MSGGLLSSRILLRRPPTQVSIATRKSGETLLRTADVIVVDEHATSYDHVSNAVEMRLKITRQTG